MVAVAAGGRRQRLATLGAADREFPARVGRNIQAALELQKMTSLELAGAIKAPRGVVYDWLKGRGLTLEALADIAAALNVAPETLVTGVLVGAEAVV